MARLLLKPGETYRSVGHVVVKMAEAVHRQDIAKAFDPKPAYQYEDEFQSLFNETFLEVPESLKTLEEPEIDSDGTMVLFHFDRTRDIDGKTVRIINIAVPDFEGKSTSQNDRDEPITQQPQHDNFDLTDVAAEAFGFIVICGCVG